MPVVLRVRGYRFWFYAADLDEPPHVHVGRDGEEAKFWINPVRLARPGRFRSVELREIERILAAFQQDVMSTWDREVKRRDRSES